MVKHANQPFWLPFMIARQENGGQKFQQQQLMLKFTALLSDEFRQSTSFSSLKTYHEEKRKTFSEWGNQSKHSNISFGNKNQPSSLRKLPYEQRTIRRGQSHLGFGPTHQMSHVRSNTDVDHLILEKKYLPEQHTEAKRLSQQDQNMSRDRIKTVAPQKNENKTALKHFHQGHHSGVDSKKMNIFCSMDQNYDPLIQRKFEKRDDKPIRQLPQGKMRISRLNNLESIQKKIEATLNLRKKLVI